MTTLLSVRGLHKSYGNKPILVDAWYPSGEDRLVQGSQ